MLEIVRSWPDIAVLRSRQMSQIAAQRRDFRDPLGGIRRREDSLAERAEFELVGDFVIRQ